jgi:Zn-dependent protease with chaperone function
MSSTTFVGNALCFGPDLPAAGAACHVEVSPIGLSLGFPESYPLPEDVPFTVLTVQAGGFDRDQLVLKWARNGAERVVYLKDPDVILAFRRSAPAEFSQAFEQTAAHVRSARRGRRTVLITAAALVVAFVLSLWLGFDALVGVVVDQFPVEWETSIGEAALRDFLSGQSVVKEGPAVTAMQEMLHRLVKPIPETPYRFEVTVVRSEVVNAFALPGGSVVVFTGLIKEADGPDEVAGVLSHELNHVLLRHGLKRQVKNLGFFAVITILFGDAQAMTQLARRLAMQLLPLKFSRAQETEADLAGLRLLHEARISPAGLIQFFERLSRTADLRGVRVELLSTHPMSAARAERLRQEAAALPLQSPVPFSFDWQAVQTASRLSVD